MIIRDHLRGGSMPRAPEPSGRTGRGSTAPRSISAVCKADIVLRVWLVDGTAIDAVADHISARVTCP